MIHERLSEAIRILRANQRDVGKRHNRIHNEAADDNVHRLRALDGGICGDCRYLKLGTYRGDGRVRVQVRCAAGNSPVALYRHTELGIIPTCPDLSP